jgi:outer membrane protein OmpA-like peptidoglycan-associated protein
MAQQETYTVKKAPFSSDKYDEYSPVFYKNGIVFCTNSNSGISNYSNSKNEGLFKFVYIDTVGGTAGRRPKLFSKDLTTKFNDGPVTFSSRGDTIYYSRNLEVKGKLGELSGGRNKLGIFSAVKSGNKWTKIREQRINNEWYNVSTPWLSPDGKRLFFASDKPGGFGGSDLYYCQWKGDYWDDPVNLGPIINTKGNEAYPFINTAGELFFSSDGHPGFGGKDIFFSRFADTAWLPPVCLDPPINSQHDDFGIITDTLMNEGYFSSNRDKSIDIYHFKTNYPQIFYSNIQRENQYCFMFNDSGLIDVDTTNLQLEWYFGDGKSAYGAIVKYCFPGPGNYNVRLNIVERSTGKLFFIKLSYNLELRDFEQPYINSPDVAVKGDVIEFDGLKSNLPGYKILNYSWDFGDGDRSSALNIRHSFKEKGEYIVSLELTIRSDSTGNIRRTSVSKKISIFDDRQEKDSFLAERAPVKAELNDVRNYDCAKIKTQYSAEIEYQQDVVFCVELLSSENRVGINSSVFRNLPKEYTLKEKFNPDDGTYSYTVDQQMSLMATYPAYREMIGLGFKDAQIKIFVLSDPAEKEIYNLIKIYGANAEFYFDPSDRLTSNAYLMLDQIVKVMNKYPLMKLEIAVHSDNIGSAVNNLALTQRRSQVLVNYIINRGISTNRLVATGFGELKPIAPNFLEKDRKLNRRIDFIVISE